MTGKNISNSVNRAFRTIGLIFLFGGIYLGFLMYLNAPVYLSTDAVIKDLRLEKLRPLGFEHNENIPLNIYTYAMEQLGVKAENTIALEDSGNGWLSAQAAGLKCVVTINDYTANQDFTGADLVVSEFGEADRDAVDVLINKHSLNDLHHVTLAHLQTISEA